MTQNGSSTVLLPSSRADFCCQSAGPELLLQERPEMQIVGRNRAIIKIKSILILYKNLCPNNVCICKLISRQVNDLTPNVSFFFHMQVYISLADCFFNTLKLSVQIWPYYWNYCSSLFFRLSACITGWNTQQRKFNDSFVALFWNIFYHISKKIFYVLLVCHGTSLVQFVTNFPKICS